MMMCYCGSQKKYQNCCEPFHINTQRPETPEHLMRSRYSAYCRADIAYIEKTMQGKAKEGFDVISATLWAKRVVWISLQIVRTSMQGEAQGQVEFIARFVDNKILQHIHELSDFQYVDGQWYYIDGIQYELKNLVISRKNLCPCGSNNKWKHCHGKTN